MSRRAARRGWPPASARSCSAGRQVGADQQEEATIAPAISARGATARRLNGGAPRFSLRVTVRSPLGAWPARSGSGRRARIQRAIRNEALNAAVAALSTSDWIWSRRSTVAARSAGSVGNGSNAGPITGTLSPSAAIWSAIRAREFELRPGRDGGSRAARRSPPAGPWSRSVARSAVNTGVSTKSPTTTPAWRAAIVQPPWIAWVRRPRAPPR